MRLLLLSLFGCPAEDSGPADKVGTDTACDPVAAQADAPAAVPGAPQAGVASTILDFPVGTPLSGYTSRCGLLGGGEGNPDQRGSNYVTKFSPSAGVQTPIPVKVIWLSDGDQDFVLVKADVIYSFDGLVEELERRLSEATGKDLDGKVVVAANHSHASYGDFTDQVTYYLGSDAFNYEIFLRMAERMEEAALAAHTTLAPVKLGMGFARDWDPEDKVYHDRRGDNDDLQVFDDIPAGSYKDPTLTMLRIDTLEDEPVAVLYDFGIHGTTLGGDNPMASVEAPGHTEIVFEERFDSPVLVFHVQGGGGDASPSGSDSFYANLESTGEYAADALEELWASIPTSADPITLETASRAIPETNTDIRVTRNGTVDWYYLPYDEAYVPDDVVYGADGEILSPLDEFNTLAGEAFCGEDPPYIPGLAPADVFPYNQCVPVVNMAALITNYFDVTDSRADLPLRESTRASVSALRIGPLPIVDPDGSTTTDDVLFGFFPGEPTALYTEQFRRRAEAELGYAHSVAVGYAQDHEGYLLIPEDWLQGGYEADINIWGPLQGEHIMEGLLTMAGEHLSTDVVEAQDPCGLWQPVEYNPWSLPTLVPDPSPEAGTALDTSFGEYLYTPLLTEEELEAETALDLSWSTTVPRVKGIVQMAWIGGDPAVDAPLVTLETKVGDSWEAVTTASGRNVTLGPDILLAYTPDPRYPATDVNTHRWWAAWQAVSHVVDRAGFPEGTYRLHVSGKTYTGSNDTWPWDSTEYEVYSGEFQVVAGSISTSWDGTTLTASLLGPERGWRLIGLDGNYRGDNPLPEDRATIVIHRPDGSEELELVGSRSGGVTVFSDLDFSGATRVELTDIYGNRSELVF